MEQLLMIETGKISPCPYQCRYSYSMEAMQQLIASIKQNGILQPLTATKCGDGYQLVSGHRRLLAARVIGLEKVPVIVTEKTAEEIAVLCTIENIHREDLNCFEQARAIQLLINQLGLTQQQAGERLCLTQSAVANKLKLLKLADEDICLAVQHKLTERHIRAVLRLEADRQHRALLHIIKHNLNVAATDSYINSLLKPKQKGKTIIKLKDVRLFTNTITNAVNIMKKAGFAPLFEQNITENRAEYKIVIPLEKKTGNLADKAAKIKGKERIAN